MRTCIKCNVKKDESAFYHRPDGRARGRFCKLCESARCMKRYFIKHDEISKKNAEYRKNNKSKIKKRAAIARSKYNHSEYSAAKMKEYRDKFSNAYLKARLRKAGLKNEEITNDAIEEKRVQCIIERIKKVISQTGIKICSICQQKKKTNEYYQRQWRWGGLKKIGTESVCKDCSKIRNRGYKKNERHSKPKKSLV